MKRSDMVKLIYDSFYNAEAGKSLESADYVLERLEDVGMLPPGRKIKELRVGPCWEIEVDTTVNTWEDG